MDSGEDSSVEDSGKDSCVNLGWMLRIRGRILGRIH